jgi:hypothetical protein
MEFPEISSCRGDLPIKIISNPHLMIVPLKKTNPNKFRISRYFPMKIAINWGFPNSVPIFSHENPNKIGSS